MLTKFFINNIVEDDFDCIYIYIYIYFAEMLTKFFINNIVEDDFDCVIIMRVPLTSF